MKFLIFYPRTIVAAQENGTGVLNGTGAPCPPGYATRSCLMARGGRAKFLFHCPGLLRVERPALAVWHHLLRVLLGWVFFKDNFWASFWAYLHITYKTLNKTN